MALEDQDQLDLDGLDAPLLGPNGGLGGDRIEEPVVERIEEPVVERIEEPVVERTEEPVVYQAPIVDNGTGEADDINQFHRAERLLEDERRRIQSQTQSQPQYQPASERFDIAPPPSPSRFSLRKRILIGFGIFFAEIAAVGFSAGIGSAIGALVFGLAFPLIGAPFGAAFGAIAGAALGTVAVGIGHLLVPGALNTAYGTVLTAGVTGGVGAVVGAIVGTILLPGLGTAAGAYIGAGLGVSVSLLVSGLMHVIKTQIGIVPENRKLKAMNVESLQEDDETELAEVEYQKNVIESKKTSRDLGAFLAGLGATGVGATVGAIVGSIVPVFGTAFGAIVGAGIGLFGSAAIGGILSIPASDKFSEKFVSGMAAFAGVTGLGAAAGAIAGSFIPVLGNAVGAVVGASIAFGATILAVATVAVVSALIGRIWTTIQEKRQEARNSSVESGRDVAEAILVEHNNNGGLEGGLSNAAMAMQGTGDLTQQPQREQRDLEEPGHHAPVIQRLDVVPPPQPNNETVTHTTIAM